jgi:hypothetical protein
VQLTLLARQEPAILRARQSLTRRLAAKVVTAARPTFPTQAADRERGLATAFRAAVLAMAFPATVAAAMSVTATVDQAMVDQAMVDQATADQATVAPATADPATVDPATVDPATADPATADPATADPATADPATADPASADPVMVAPGTADPASADPATAVPATAVPATVAPATADPATADPATADPATVVLATADPATADPATGMETVDRSAERAFFGRTTPPSDHPVSFDTEFRSEPLDLERREQRRARFTRVVGGIVVTLGVGALLALTRPAPGVAEAAPIAATRPSAVEVTPIDQAQPKPTPSPELSVSRALGGAPEQPAAAAMPAAAAAAAAVPVSTLPAVRVRRALATPAVSAPARRSSPAAAEPHRQVRAPQATAGASFVPAQTDDRPPPTARFAD